MKKDMVHKITTEKEEKQPIIKKNKYSKKNKENEMPNLLKGLPLKIKFYV